MDDDLQPHNEEQLHDWAMGLVDDGQQRRLPWEGVWWENLATYAGDLWVEWDVHKRRLREPVRKPDHKVRLPVNLAQPAVRTELAKLTKNRPIVDVLARSNEETDLNAAKVGEKMLNDYAEREFHMGRVRRRMLMWTLICGAGGIFVDYDETMGKGMEFLQDPKGNPVMDPRVIEAYRQYYKKKKKAPKTMTVPQGDLRIIPLSPFQLIFDFSQVYFEDSWWCIVSEVYDCDKVEVRWGTRPEPEPNAMPGVIERRMLSRFDLTNKLGLQNPKNQHLCVVHRLFVKPEHPYFPDGAHVVFTEKEIIHKEGFPFQDHELPVGWMGHVPMPTGQHPMSTLQQLRGPVLELSRTASQLIENRNLMANPPWVVPKQLQLKGDTIQNKPGLRMEYNHLPNVPPPQPVKMPEMPAYVSQLIGMMEDFIRQISGQGETSQGAVPPGARSGVAIAYMQESDDTRLGPTVQEYEEVIEQVGGLTLERFAQCYTTPRMIRLYRRNSEPEVFDFLGAMLAGNTTVICQAGSALPRSKAAKQQFILDLWDRKLEQDPRRVRQMLELSEGEPDQWEVDMQQAQRENRELMQGGAPTVIEWYNHAAHHYVHRNFMKSVDFENLPLQVQNKFRQHDDLHTQMEQSEQVKAAQLQQLQQGPQGNGGPPPQGGPPSPGSVANATSNGQNNPDGPPPQFSDQIPPSSLVDAQPQ